MTIHFNTIFDFTVPVHIPVHIPVQWLETPFLKGRKQLHIWHHYKLATTVGIIEISLYCCWVVLMQVWVTRGVPCWWVSGRAQIHPCWLHTACYARGQWGQQWWAPSGSETVMSVVTYLSTRGVEGMCVEWSELNSIASFPGLFLLVSGMSLPFQCMMTNYMHKGAL